MDYTKERMLAKGWSSYIWLVEDEHKNKFIMKEVREKSPRKDLAHREGTMLSRANSVGVGPKLIEANLQKNYVIREYIHGKRLLDWVLEKEFEGVTQEELYAFIKSLYRQLLALDAIHLSHNQLEVGKNILVEKKSDPRTGIVKYVPHIIDFEKASLKANHTKNVGQVESMLFYNPHGLIAQNVRKKLGVELTDHKSQ